MEEAGDNGVMCLERRNLLWKQPQIASTGLVVYRRVCSLLDPSLICKQASARAAGQILTVILSFPNRILAIQGTRPLVFALLESVKLTRPESSVSSSSGMCRVRNELYL